MAANANPGTNVYTSAAAPNKFGSSPKDSNREPIPFANAIITQDYTGRAQSPAAPASDITSPTAVLTTNAIALQIPPNAVTMTMNSTAAFQISEVGPAGAPLTQSFQVPANTSQRIEVARQKFIYVTGTAALNFFFHTL